ncbi:hypothetical protein QQM79_13610 [Marinobacteraceae bacterium S3BR75-40.1]
MPKVSFRLSLTALISVFILSGCLSSAEDAANEVKNDPNDFPQIKNDGNSFENSGGDAQGGTNETTGLAANEVRLTLQVPRQMAGEDGIDTRRNLRIVQPNSVRVVRVDNNLTEQETFNTTTRQDDELTRIITFPDLSSVPRDPDIIAIATYGGTEIRGPIYDGNDYSGDNDFKINPFTDYLVTETFSSLTPGEITALKQCQNQLCLEGVVWPALVDQAEDFEIEIPSDFTLSPGETYLSKSKDYLASRGDFTRYVAQMKNALLTGQDDVSDSGVASATFNSIYFGLGLSRVHPSANSTQGQWSTRISNKGSRTGNGAPIETYPTLTFTSLGVAELDINITGIDNDIPYSRETLRQLTQSSYLKKDDWKPNAHSASPGGAFVRDGAFIQAGRSPYQSITEEENDVFTGWAPNPYFYNGKILGTLNDPEAEDEPQAVLSSYFQSAKAILLDKTSGSYSRDRTLEEMGIGTFELGFHRLSKTEPEYDLSKVNGDYYASEFFVALADSGDPIRAEVRLRSWSADPSSHLISEAPAGAAYAVERDGSTGLVSAPAATTNSNTYKLVSLANEMVTDSKIQKYKVGRLRLEDQNNGPNLAGAGAPNGQWLGFTHNSDSMGRGIKIVMQDSGQTVDASGETYLLQGFMLGMEDDKNRLHQLNESTLTLDSNSSASLNLCDLVVTHTISSQAVTDPTFEGCAAYNDSAAIYNGGGQNGSINTTFTVDGTPFQLQGFMSAPDDGETAGEELLLIAKWGNRVGLLMGHLQQ